MTLMFGNCISIRNLDLTNFQGKNINNMNAMFFNCSSLTNLNMKKFKSNDYTYFGGLFSGCLALKKENVICNDKNIMEQIYLI